MTLVKRLFAKAWVTPLPQGVNMTPVRKALSTQRKILAKVFNPKYKGIETKVLHHRLKEEWPSHPWKQPGHPQDLRLNCRLDHCLEERKGRQVE